MVDQVRTDAHKPGEPPKGPSPKLLRDVLGKGIETAAKTFLSSYLGNETAENLAGITRQFVDKAIDGFSPGAARGEPLRNEAGAYASQFLDQLLKNLAGDPPEAPKGSRNLQYLKHARVVETDGGFKLSNPEHLLGAALKKLGIPDIFGAEINKAIAAATADRSITSLTEGVKGDQPGSWLKTIRYLFAGMLKEKDSTSKLGALLGKIPIEDLVAVKPKTTTQPTDTVEPAPPKSEMNENTSHRADTARGSNFAAFYIAERAYGAKAGKAETPKVESYDHLIEQALQGLQLTGVAPEKIAAIAKDVKKALAPLERASKVDNLAVNQELLKLLISDSAAQERSIKGLRTSVTSLQQKKTSLEGEIGKLDASKPENKDALDKLKAQLDTATGDLETAKKNLKGAESAAERSVTWNNLYEYVTSLSEMGLQTMDLEKDAKGIDKLLNLTMAFNLEKLIAQRLGVEIPGDSVSGVLKKYSKLLENIQDNGALSARSRERFDKEQKKAKEANPESDLKVYAPLISAIDPKDKAGSAKKIAESIMAQIGAPGKAEDLAQVLTGIIERSQTNLDLIGGLISEIKKRTGLDEQELQLDKILQVTSGITERHGQITEHRKDIENLDSAIRNLTHQIQGLDPSGISTQLASETAKRDRLTEKLEKQNARLAELDTEIGKLDARLKKKPRNPQEITTQLDKLKKEKHGLEAKYKPETEKQLSDANTKIGELEKKTQSFPAPDEQAVEYFDAKAKLARTNARLEALTKAEKPNQTLIDELKAEIAGLETKVSGLETPERKTYAENRSKAEELVELKLEAGELKDKLSMLEKVDLKDPQALAYYKMLLGEEPSQAMIDGIKKQIGDLETKMGAIKTPEREAYAESRAKLVKLMRERENMGHQRAQFKGQLEHLEGNLNRLEGDTHRASGMLMQMLGGVVANAEEIEKDKQAREKATKEPKDTKTRDQNRSESASTPTTQMSPAQRQKNALIQERIRMCDSILSDPSLSTQDKILLFILTYAEYKKREQEGDLREFNKQEERRTQWQEDREEMERKIKGQQEVVDDLGPRVDKAKGELAALERTEKGSPKHAEKAKEVEGLQHALRTANDEIKIGSENLEKHDTAPEAKTDREMKLMLIERSMQEYDHLLRMADSLLQRYDRLVDQILRSMGQ